MPMAPEGLLRPMKWPTRRLMPKNSITSRPPAVLDRAPFTPSRIAAGMAHSTSPAAAAAELRLRRFSQRDGVGPDAPTLPLPDAGPDSALEVIRSQSSAPTGRRPIGRYGGQLWLPLNSTRDRTRSGHRQAGDLGRA